MLIHLDLLTASNPASAFVGALGRFELLRLEYTCLILSSRPDENAFPLFSDQRQSPMIPRRPLVDEKLTFADASIAPTSAHPLLFGAQAPFYNNL